MKNCRTKFYMARNAGMYCNGVNPSIAAYLWKVAIQPSLLYGTECIPLRQSDKIMMDKLQAKLVKSALGLSKYLRSTALIKALNIKLCGSVIAGNTLRLFSSMLNDNSFLKPLYFYMLQHPAKINGCDNLLTRTDIICKVNCFSLVKCILHEDYVKSCKRVLFDAPRSGLVDSLKILLSNFNDHNKEMIKLLLSPF